MRSGASTDEIAIAAGWWGHHGHEGGTMPRAQRFDDVDDDLEENIFGGFDDDDDDQDDADIDEDDVDEEARAFYEEHAAPLTPADTVEILAAAAGDAASWFTSRRTIRVPAMGDMVCRGCGCSDNRACPGGCFWAAPNLCSRCAA